MVRQNNHASPPSEVFGELAQARIRNFLHLLLVSLTFASYQFESFSGITTIALVSIASLVASLSLYVWARMLQFGQINRKYRHYQRVASIVSDNLFISLVLIIGGASTAGAWALYIWVTIGVGVRYGVTYLHSNLVVAVISFVIVTAITPFWHSHPSFSLGLLLGMIVVPLYTGWLIKKLHTAIEEKDQAYAAKSQFLARMSHELRTPLHAIISTTDILQTTKIDKSQHELLTIVSTASTTLLDLINKVLDLSRFETRSIELIHEPLNIYQVIADSFLIVLPQARKNSLEARVNVDPNIDPYLVGPNEEIKEIIVNLFGNAAKFTTKGFISLTVELLKEDAKEVTIKIAISDSGPGIPPDEVAKIFEPFSQLESTRTRKHGGSGLGTTFSQELARLMGTTIKVNTKPDIGTTFEFDLALGRQLETPSPPEFFRFKVGVIGLEHNKTLIEHLRRLGVDVYVWPTGAPHGTLPENVLEISTGKNSISYDAIIASDHASDSAIAFRNSLYSEEMPFSYTPILFVNTCTAPFMKGSEGVCLIEDPSNERTIRNALCFVALLRPEFISGAYAEGPDAPINTSSAMSLKVLVAEDNSTNQTIAKMVLSQAGYQCVIVSDGEEALLELETGGYDLAILDMHMPKCDGIEVAKIYNFAQVTESPPIPIILLTADTTREARLDATAAGITQYLTKPIRPRELLTAIENLVPKNRVEIHSFRGACLPGSAQSSSDSNTPTVTLNESSVSDLLDFMSDEERLQFFGEFFEDVSNYLQVLENADCSETIKKAQNAMHALAGAAVTVGAEELAEIAKTIEHLSEKEFLSEKRNIVKRVKTCSDSTIEEVRKAYC